MSSTVSMAWHAHGRHAYRPAPLVSAPLPTAVHTAGPGPGRPLGASSPPGASMAVTHVGVQPEVCCETMEQADLHGLDMRHETLGTPALCCRSCVLDADCRGWTFDGEICWLKSGVPLYKPRVEASTAAKTPCDALPQMSCMSTCDLPLIRDSKTISGKLSHRIRADAETSLGPDTAGTVEPPNIGPLKGPPPSESQSAVDTAAQQSNSPPSEQAPGPTCHTAVESTDEACYKQVMWAKTSGIKHPMALEWCEHLS